MTLRPKQRRARSSACWTQARPAQKSVAVWQRCETSWGRPAPWNAPPKKSPPFCDDLLRSLRFIKRAGDANVTHVRLTNGPGTFERHTESKYGSSRTPRHLIHL